jgi:RNA polymerase sigma-70 factor (ECF subfamily)
MAMGQTSGLVSLLWRAAHRTEAVDTDDSDLLERYLRERDETAFESLLRRHGAMVLGVCRRLLRNEADAHDAFQATFLVFVRKADSIHPRGRVGNWLYGVACKTARKAKAMNRLRSAREQQAGAAQREEVSQELHGLLDEELSHLPDRYRTPLVLCELEGRSLKEVAQQLGCPQGTIASRLSRAREMLARRLARYGLALSGGALSVALAQGASAAVPASLVVSTVQAAAAVAAGQAATVGVLSPSVAALTEGMLKTMLLTKVKALTAGLVALVLLGGGGGLLTYHALKAEPPGARQASRLLGATLTQEKDKSDKGRLQGTWLPVSGEKNGKKMPKEKYQDGKMVFAGNKVTLQTQAGEQEREGTFTLDPDKDPREIDLTFGTQTHQGIYELKGTTLKVVFMERGRPTDFDSTNATLMVFKKK